MTNSRGPNLWGGHDTCTDAYPIWGRNVYKEPILASLQRHDACTEDEFNGDKIE